MVREGVGEREFLIHLLIYSNKLAYLQLVTVLVYGSFQDNCHREKLPPNPNSNANPKPNPNPNRGAIFLGGNCPGTL